ncbi:MAG: chorismate synthase [Bacteroidales bacterium]|nr:chorismate synthase [Bacteroidales bacterium]MBD5217306.1 chorismate synthase [Bacteroidales bacterium]
MNTFGRTLRLTTFGESHGEAIGGIIDGFPAGFRLDLKAVQAFVSARRPGASPLTSTRNEPDIVQFLSGISPEGITFGYPIGFIIKNSDTRPSDYANLRDVFRPNHADFTYQAKYGLRDHRGGGRSSARETANWVVAGALAIQLLQHHHVAIEARLVSVGKCGDPTLFHSYIEQIRALGDSVGGCVEGIISGLPAGVGDPIFDKLDARLAHAMLTINGAKGFESGAGFEMARALGSEVSDTFKGLGKQGSLTDTNFCGGVLGGISDGMPVTFRVAFKPTPTIGHPLPTIDSAGNPATLRASGRHDPCIAVRGAHVVKAMAALCVADLMLSDGFIPPTAVNRTYSPNPGL